MSVGTLAGTSNYTQNKVIDWFLRAQSFSPAATTYVALLTAGNGAILRNTHYSSGEYASIVASDGNNHLYKCTTTGQTGASSSGYTGTLNEVVNDGMAVFTEQTSVLQAAGAAVVEVSGGSYARVGITSGLTEWAGTQSAGSTTASSGTSATTSNNAAVTFPTATADWTTAPMAIWGFAIYDASSSGNLLLFGGLTANVSVLNGDIVNFAISALTYQIDQV
jgi:hypothetical protein